MPALDQCHAQVVRALEKEGWRVKHSPYTISYEKRTLFVDIELDKQVNGISQSIIVVEVKCFADPNSETTDLYTAIGQYLVYRSLLNQKNISIPLYLVVPSSAFHGIFQQLALPVVNEVKIKMIVVDLAREVVQQWRD